VVRVRLLRLVYRALRHLHLRIMLLLMMLLVMLLVLLVMDWGVVETVAARTIAVVRNHQVQVSRFTT
jgi:hypothetical protein